MAKKKKLLEIVEDDQDTIVVDAKAIAAEEAKTEVIAAEAPEAEAGGAVPAPAVYREPDSEGAATARKPASRGLYALFEILAPLAGTVTGILMALTFGVANLLDITGFSAEHLEDLELSPYGWVANFSNTHAQAEFISRNITFIIITSLVFLAAVIGLCVVTGRFSRDEEGKIRLNWFDRLWSELHIAAGVCAAAAAVGTAAPVAKLVSCTNKIGPIDLSSVYKPIEPDDYFFEIPNNSVFWYCAIGMFVLIAIAVICWVTLVKKIKARELIHRSLLGKILAFLGIGAVHAGHKFAKTGEGIAKASKGLAARNKNAFRSLTIPADADRRAAVKLMIKYILIACVLLWFPVFVYALEGGFEALFFLMIVSTVLAAILIIRKVGKLAEIRAGVIEVKSGNLTHKIPVTVDENGPKTDLDKLASDINHISEATNAAVQNEIKNQRLKTDLISNVSHDLKTPLTSMISYLDILDKEGLDSPDAPAHLAIVREKTDRLKTLTEELFEAAKASSGNIPCEIETIDLAALIDQSLAEMGDRLSSKNLEVKKKITAENTMVRADGKLLYRVLENLLGNISKYALEGSRVYIDVSKPAGTAAPAKLLLEIKNISRDELNISPDELMERFTRGDQSRNTEGSGLGLAIAKDLTNLMGGVFEIKIDGDMFKVSILLNEA